MRLSQYTKKDLQIFLAIVPVVVITLNTLLFDGRYFSDFRILILSSFVVGIIISITWLSLTWIAVMLRRRLPGDNDLFRRIGLALVIFLLITGLMITTIFRGYDYFNLFGYKLNESRYHITLLVGAILNVFVTFVHEGVDSFEKWKATLTETARLKKEYQQSQLLGLKSHVNPHFLFNSLNSLSCLIQEEPAKAEMFLDEMSKVYRYLLRSNEEQLVELETELQFIRSYTHIVKERHGEGIRLNINIDNNTREKLIPPLTLHLLFEKAFNESSISKDFPLYIEISSLRNGWLQFRYNIQLKVGQEKDIPDAGLENIINKFRLLCQEEVLVKDTGLYKTIQMPLIMQKEIAV